jgi:hypothetical protein
LVEGRVAGVRGERPAAWHQRPQATINVTVKRNKREMLGRYNQRVIGQGYERVPKPSY